MNGGSTNRVDLIDVALGHTPPDAVVAGGTVVNVLSGDMHAADILIKGSRIAALSEPGTRHHSKTQIIDATGLFLVPGLIDPHMHIESSSISTAEFARCVVSRGVTTVAIDPHEFGNVVGIEGIRVLFESASGLPLRLLLRVPARVPEMSTDLETPGAEIDRAATVQMLDWPEAVCLAGDINAELILRKDTEHLWRIEAAIAAGKTVSGYVPPLSNAQSNAMIASGIEDSHVARNIDQLRENLRLGLHVLLTPRPGRFEMADFKDLAKELEAGNLDSHRISLCTDDVLVNELRLDGHLDARIRMAIKAGIPALKAIQMATINTARLLRRERDIGSLAAGRLADIAMLRDLETLEVAKVVYEGALAFEDKAFTRPLPKFEWPDWCRATINHPQMVSGGDLAIKGNTGASTAECRVVVSGYPKTITTDTLGIVDGKIAPSVSKDRLAVAVLDRHQQTGNVGKGFVTGMGLHSGAIASSINHNCHHHFAIGADLDDMAVALNRIAEMNGGYAAARDGIIIGDIPLPVIGMISDLTADELADEFTRFETIIRAELGWKPVKRPLYVLNFICSPVVPRYGFTDKGLVDADELRVIDVVV
jgi:adenine deaminase